MDPVNNDRDRGYVKIRERIKKNEKRTKTKRRRRRKKMTLFDATGDRVETARMGIRDTRAEGLPKLEELPRACWPLSRVSVGTHARLYLIRLPKLTSSLTKINAIRIKRQLNERL